MSDTPTKEERDTLITAAIEAMEIDAESAAADVAGDMWTLAHYCDAIEARAEEAESEAKQSVGWSLIRYERDEAREERAEARRLTEAYRDEHEADKRLPWETL